MPQAPNTTRREILQCFFFSPQFGYCYFSIYSVEIFHLVALECKPKGLHLTSALADLALSGCPHLCASARVRNHGQHRLYLAISNLT